MLIKFQALESANEEGCLTISVDMDKKPKTLIIRSASRKCSSVSLEGKQQINFVNALEYKRFFWFLIFELAAHYIWAHKRGLRLCLMNGEFYCRMRSLLLSFGGFRSYFRDTPCVVVRRCCFHAVFNDKDYLRLSAQIRNACTQSFILLLVSGDLSFWCLRS